MALSQNQFTITTLSGTLIQGDTMTMEFYDASAATVVAPGEFVTISAVSNPSPAGIKCAKGSAITSSYFGVVVTNPLKDSYSVGEKLEVAKLGSIVILSSNTAITAGGKVQYNPSTKLIEAYGTSSNGTDIGIALETAVNQYDLIKVFIYPAIA